MREIELRVLIACPSHLFGQVGDLRARPERGERVEAFALVRGVSHRDEQAPLFAAQAPVHRDLAGERALVAAGDDDRASGVEVGRAARVDAVHLSAREVEREIGHRRVADAFEERVHDIDRGVGEVEEGGAAVA